MTPVYSCRTPFVCVALLSAACGQVASEKDPEPPSVSTASGSRLKARLLRAADGATVFQGWYDSELGIDCAFEAAMDGEYRCLPVDRGTYVYTDNACTVSARGFARDGVPPYVFGDSESVSESPCLSAGLEPAYSRPVYTLDRELPGAASHAYIGDGCADTSSCSGDVRLFDPDQKTAVAPELFVRADLVVEERTDRVGAETFVADDGAREVRGAHNRESGMGCSGPEWGLDLCLPQNVAYSEVIPWRSDPECTHAVAHGWPLECPAAELILRSAGHFGVCEGSVTLHEVGADVPSSTIYEPRNTQDPVSGAFISGCVSDMDAHAGDAFYEIGPEITDERFAPLGYRTHGSGAVRTRFRIAPPSPEPVGSGWFVDEHDEELSVMRLADGRLHAVTADTYSVDGSLVFSDSACLDEAAVVYADPCTDATRPAIAYSTDACTGLTTLYALVPSEQPGGFERADAGCVPTTALSLGERATVYAVGEVIDPATYPVLEEIIE